MIRSSFKVEIPVPYHGETEFQHGYILTQVEDLKRRRSAKSGPKDGFETASRKTVGHSRGMVQEYRDFLCGEREL
jgi:hypothetical protein